MKELHRTPIRLLALAAALSLTCHANTQSPSIPVINESVPQPFNDYPLTADSQPQPNVPHGNTFKFEWNNSTVFPGTTRTITVYVLAQYKADKPACTFVLLDGIGYKADTVFANRFGNPYLVTSINHLHKDVTAPKEGGKRKPIFSADFVMHSLRHTMLTRLGESGVDAFTIMRIAGHSSIVVSQRYIHPTPETVECAFERLQLSAKVVAITPKRRLPATVSATLEEREAVSY
jgi:hypothetical protein